MSKLLIALCGSLFIFAACVDPHPNQSESGKDLMKENLSERNIDPKSYQDTVYIPVYSDIYSESSLKSTLLTATLSIRSTSLQDTTYLHIIDYYDTGGAKVKSYIDKTLVLAPMQSIDYVIARDDDTGGVGANFMVMWSADKNTKPIFQAVMISTQGQHGLSFVTNGVSLKNK